MTNKELKEKYLKLYIIVVEEIRDDLGSSMYKDVERIANDTMTSNLFYRGNNYVGDILDNEIISLGEFIALEIAVLLINTVGIDKLISEDSDLRIRIEDFYQRHLRFYTRKFTSKYGLPEIKNITNNLGTIKLVELK
jgi:hypothetical protein